ncbi:MAG: hypothetical protein Q8O19_08095 [Rectinemataceae bacterium]|nr:hypothetical protein [Rectinemataceae bacterium]
MRKKSRLNIIYLIIISVIESCGLYSYISLNPPISFESKGSSLLELHHDLNNNDGSEKEFLGYEIFYRAYDIYEIADGDKVLLIDAVDKYEKSPDGFITYAKSLGFQRLQKYTDSNPDISPLISISDSSPSLYYLELVPEDFWIISPDTSITLDDTKITRNIIANYATRYSFNKKANYQEGDIDYEGKSSPTTVYFVFFATAFGTDTASFSNIYSEAKVIGTTLQYNPSN